MKNSIFDLKECPNCGFNLDDGDIYDVLKSLKEYESFSDEQIIKFAEGYGWKKNKKKHFSKLIGIGLKFKCPECEQFIK
jgi:hypothetical protein